MADEGSHFELLGVHDVRFGEGERWATARLDGTYRCDAATFGADPSPARAKTCEVILLPQASTMARLAWQASADALVVGYRVYHGARPGSYLQPLGSGLGAGLRTTFAVVGLATGRRHYFAVTAVDSAGSESSYSNEASKKGP